MEIIVDNQMTALKLLLELSNKESEKYDMRTYNVADIGTYETFDQEKQTIMLHGSVWVVGLKEVLDQIDECKTSFEPEVLKNQLIRLINSGNSLAVMTDYIYRWNVLPSEFAIREAEITGINACGVITDLCCYTFDDELGASVKSLKSYVESYDGSIRNVPKEEIIAKLAELDKQSVLTIKKPKSTY